MIIFLQYFNYAFPLPFPFMASYNKSSVNLIEDLLYIKSLNAFATFEILYLILAFNGFITMCLGVNLFAFVPLGDFCSFLLCRVQFSSHLRILGHYFLKYSFSISCLWNSQNVHVDMFNAVLQISKT